MRRLVSLSLALVLVPAALAAQAKGPTIPKAAVGSWTNKAMTGPKDSVVATNTTTISADGKITVQFPGRPLLTGRLLAAGGDSVATEVGPYESVVKKGLKVTTKTVSHYRGSASTGTFDAKYSDGSALHGKMNGTKKQ